MPSCALAGFVVRPSSVPEDETEAKGSGNRNGPKFVILAHFAMTFSGDNALLTGNPCPPACCQRVWAAHPPETSNREPVVALLSKKKELDVHAELDRMTNPC
jgi:hypothetical protein